MPKINTNFAVVLLNETSTWDDNYEVKQAAGEIWTAYLVDLNRPVHMADIRPSYDLIPLYYVPKNHLDDRLDEMLKNDFNLFSEIDSRYCYVIEEIIKNGKAAIIGEETHEYDEGVDADETYNTIEQKAIENENANVRDWVLSDPAAKRKP